MSDPIIDPLSDGNANGSSGGSSLGLNSTGGDKEQQVVTGVPPPGLSAPAGNDEQAGLPPALLAGGGSDATPAGQSATEGNGAQTGHSPADEDDGSGSGIVAPTAPTVPEAAPASNLRDDALPGPSDVRGASDLDSVQSSSWSAQRREQRGYEAYLQFKRRQSLEGSSSELSDYSAQRSIPTP